MKRFVAYVALLVVAASAVMFAGSAEAAKKPNAQRLMLTIREIQVASKSTVDLAARVNADYTQCNATYCLRMFRQDPRQISAGDQWIDTVLVNLQILPTAYTPRQRLDAMLGTLREQGTPILFKNSNSIVALQATNDAGEMVFVYRVSGPYDVQATCMSDTVVKSRACGESIVAAQLRKLR